MRFTTSATILAAAAVRVAAQEPVATGQLGNAIPVEKNPPGAVYRATLGANPFFTADTPAGGPVIGEFTATTSPDGVGVMFNVELQNLPKEGGPFSYHVHVDPVPEDGNCAPTLAHLDPFIRGEDPTCDASAPATCQVGDLAGKHGKIPMEAGPNFQASFADEFLSLHEGPGAFFGNRSVVLHFANKTRIACANFQMINAGLTMEDGEVVRECTTGTAPVGTATLTPGGVNGTAIATGTGTVETAPAETNETDNENGEEEPTKVSAAAGVSAGLVATSLLSVAALFFVL